MGFPVLSFHQLDFVHLSGAICLCLGS